MMTVLVSLFGLIVGSFLNVIILRYHTGRTIGNDRSQCFACGHVLAWHELIPLVSFFMQRGRCRACGARISWQYPIVEFLTGLVFVSIWLKGGSLSNSIFYFLFSIFLIVISVHDFRTKIIPDRFVYPLIGLGAGYALLFARASLITDALAAFSAAAFFALLWLISRGRWIGFGDAKLTLGLGFFLGWPLILIALMIAFWSAAVAGIALILFKGYTRKSEVPFGPFLALGAFSSFLVGEKILLWYGGII